MRRTLLIATLIAVPVLMSGATPADTVLTVQGRASATPSIAASGAFVAVAWTASMAGGATDVFLATSRNAGETFGAAVRVNDVAGAASVSGEQPPRVVLLARPGADPSIVVVWTAKAPSGTRVVSARSDDAGKSFGTARTIAGGDAAGNRGWESAAAAPDGRVLSVWLDHRETVAAPGSGTAMAHDHLHMPKADGVAKAQLSKLYFSDGQGDARALAAGVCYCCKTSLAAAADGSVYAVWRHVYPGNIRDIAFTLSRDGGRTFAAPIRVSEDRWAIDGCPENGPALAVRGRDVHVMWPTLVGDAAGKEQAPALFYAVSHDGRTFTPRLRMPTEGTPRHPQLTATPTGTLLAAWDEAANGTRRVIVGRAAPAAAVRFTRAVLASGGTDQYPVVAAAGDGAIVAWVSGAAERSVIRVRRETPR